MTDTATVAALESRLTKLERRNRLLTTCLAAAAAIGIFTAAKTASQSASFSEVRANKLVLLDDRGREVGTWGTDAAGYPYFELRRTPYSNSLKLMDRESGPYVSFRSSGGGKITLAASPTGSSVQIAGRPGDTGSVSIQANSQNAGLTARRQNRAQIRVSAGDNPIESIKPGGTERDWYFTRGSLNLNGLNLYLRNTNGDPIQVLPQRPLPQTTQAPQKRFPLFGPRRDP